METVYFFESGIGVAVRAAVGTKKNLTVLPEDLEIDEQGIIHGIPEDKRARRFYFQILVPQDSGLVLTQKDRATGQHLGAFLNLTQTEVEGRKYWIYQTRKPIEARQLPNGHMYTMWDDGNEYCANKTNSWALGNEGQLTMREYGIVSPDGIQFMVVDMLHWVGQLYIYRGDRVSEFVGKPSEPRFEGFDRLRPICSYGPFARKLGGSLLEWKGTIKELDQPGLALPTEPNTAVIKFWNPFMVGGQGPALTADGTQVWVRGTDILGKPENGLMWDLDWGSPISYEGMEDGGAGGNPLLTGVHVL